MPKIELLTEINAPILKVFDTSRNIGLHLQSMKHTGEKAIAGRTRGLIILGETVTWKAKHFGIWQTLTSKITEFNSPTFFVDEMVSGAFKSFRHGHYFSTVGDLTLMKDVFVFEAPFGIIGKLFNIIVLKRYMTKLLIKRNEVIKGACELTSAWEEFI